MIDGSRLHANQQYSSYVLESTWSVFRTDIPQTHRLKKLLATLVSKYGLGSDTLLLSWVLKHPAKVIPIAGTVNVARIQALHKAVALELNEDWFAIWSESMGQRVP
jgi:predicted oxidoreductase